MNRRTAVALALVLGAGVVWIAAELPQGVDRLDPPSPGARPASRVEEASPDLDGSIDAACDPAPGRRIELQPAANPDLQAVAPRAGSSGPGHLVLGAIDRETRRPVESFTVRLASETRFAEERHDDPERELDLPLTPASYDGLVLSPGYEPLELRSVRVVGGETVRLTPVELLPGFGSIQVEATGVDVLDGLSVELRGLGRRPCALCLARDRAFASPCAICGYAEGSSRLRLGPDGRVHFTHLAHGPYRLRVVDEGGRTVGDDLGIDLGVGEAAIVLFDVSQSRAVELELLDSDGASLSMEWSRRLAALQVGVEEEEPEIVSFEDAGFRAIPIQMEIRRDGEGVARATFLPPQPPGMVTFGVTAIGCGFSRPRASRPTADRERGPADSLWPEPAVPRFEPAEVSCEIDARGLAILAPLSTSQLELHITAENLVADAIVPPGPGPTHVRVRLRPEDTAPAPVLSYRALELGR